MRILIRSIFFFCVLALGLSAKAAPPESWFLLDDVLSLKRAEELIEITRELFWENAKFPDGQPIKPKDETERAAVPIARMDALYFAQAAQLAGFAAWCGLDPLPYVKHTSNVAWKKYKDIRQVIFSSMLLGTVTQDIKLRKSARGECSPVDRDATERAIKYVMEKSNPAVQGTLRDKAVQRP
jgi:hypothetical protein